MVFISLNPENVKNGYIRLIYVFWMLYRREKKANRIDMKAVAIRTETPMGDNRRSVLGRGLLTKFANTLGADSVNILPIIEAIPPKTNCKAGRAY